LFEEGNLRLKIIHVKNFRCLRDATIDLDPLTVLIGPNGSGKSSLLRALEVFYSPNAKYDERDFYDQTQDITIALTFSDLNARERDQFKPYVQGDYLAVEKVMSPPPDIGTQKYFGRALRNSEFDEFRKAKGAAALRQEFEKLRTIYPSLPAYSTKDEVEQILREWEVANPDKCANLRDDGQFFGFNPVGEAHLEKFTRLIPIPAVHDAALDVAEGRGSPITQMKNVLIENELAQNAEYTELRKETHDRVMRVLPNLSRLSDEVTKFLQAYAPDSQIRLTWEESGEFDLPVPIVNTEIKEDDYYSPVPKTGHGLQRSFIMAMLQYLATTLASAKVTTSEETDGVNTVAPNLIIAIEEPELYQHPDRQRHIAKTLLSLSASGMAGLAQGIQVVYSTHSPLFVDLERFEQIRICRKILSEPEKSKHTRFSRTALDTIADSLQQIRSHGAFTGVSVKPHLRVLMTPWFNEGFFADIVVLVEGITDRTCILAVASVLGYDLESSGVAVIPYNSKNSLDYAALIFRSLEIPTYAIWDGDSSNDGAIRANRLFLRLFGAPEEDFPARVEATFAVFSKDMFDTLRNEVGTTLYGDILAQYYERFQIEEETKVLENLSMMQEIYGEIRSKGQSSPTLERIVLAIATRIAQV
jgi:putative ATP-dependent endonuclease of OLD family